MSAGTVNTKWAQCLEIVKCNVKEQEYQTWFHPIEYVDFDNGTHELLLSIPSNYFFEILDGQFKRLMYNVVWRVFGREARIIYRIQTDSTNNIVAQVEGSAGAVEPLKMDTKKKVFKAPVTKTPADDLDSQLNTEYRFDNFIEGECNKLPRSVGQSIAENPKQMTFNPLFIYGSSGVGKTHLVNAIGTRIKELHPEKRVLYVEANVFTTQYTDSFRNNNRNDFLNFYQTIDVLIIDDIQELAGQEKTQLAFFHIFNHLRMNGKQIILTSDRTPSSMQGMEERLLTRFKWGLMAELERPELELCRKILLDKMHHNGVDFPSDVVEYIVANVNSNVRDLEGIVNSLMAYSLVYNRNIDLTLAEQVVHRTVKQQSRTATLEDIMKQTCTYWKVTPEEVFSKSRKANIVQVRQVTMYLAQRLTKLTSSKIGLMVGGRNHATVLHSVKQVRDRMALDKEFAQSIHAIEAKLK